MTLKRRIKVVLSVFAILLLCAAGMTYYYCKISLSLVTTLYRVETDLSGPLRIVHLTDLHNAEFGADNRELIDMVAEQEPDLIVMTGDMLNRDEESLDTVCALISGLSGIAQVYYGYGNHELSWEAAWGKDLTGLLTGAGAVVLNNEYVDVEVNGQRLRIGGYMGYYRQPHMMTSDEEQKALELAFAEEFEDTDRFKLLLNHIPTAWVDWGYIDEFPVDIVFSGHYHGGVVRLPLLDRGLYAPYVGLLPKYTRGVFEGTQAACVLSVGLGSEHFPPRINNPPEIVVADLVPSGTD